MAVRLDQAHRVSLEELRARRAMSEAALGRRRRRRRRPPRQNLPRSQELRYRRLLLSILGEVEKAIDDTILPLVERLASQVRQNRPDASRLEVRRVDSPADDLEDAADAIRERLAKGPLSSINLGRTVGAVGSDVEAFNRRELDRVFETTIGVGLPAVEPGLSDVLRGFVRENVRRARNIANEAVDRVSASVLRGFRRGRTNREIGAEIRSELGVSKRRAHLIARDQVASLNGEISQIRQTRMGVTSYTWRSSRDERVRPTHEEFDGQVFTWATGSPEGHPGEPINCRCVAEPVLAPLFEGL